MTRRAHAKRLVSQRRARGPRRRSHEVSLSLPRNFPLAGPAVAAADLPLPLALPPWQPGAAQGLAAILSAAAEAAESYGWLWCAVDEEPHRNRAGTAQEPHGNRTATAQEPHKMK